MSRGLWFAILAAAWLGRPVPADAQQESQPQPADDTPRFESAVEVEGELSARPESTVAVTRLPAKLAELPFSVGLVPRPLVEDRARWCSATRSRT